MEKCKAVYSVSEYSAKQRVTLITRVLMKDSEQGGSSVGAELKALCDFHTMEYLQSHCVTPKATKVILYKTCSFMCDKAERGTTSDRL